MTEQIGSQPKIKTMLLPDCIYDIQSIQQVAEVRSINYCIPKIMLHFLDDPHFPFCTLGKTESHCIRIRR